MILSLFDFPIKAARIHIKKSVELMSIMSKFLYFKFSAHLIQCSRDYPTYLKNLCISKFTIFFFSFLRFMSTEYHQKNFIQENRFTCIYIHHNILGQGYFRRRSLFLLNAVLLLCFSWKPNKNSWHNWV